MCKVRDVVKQLRNGFTCSTYLLYLLSAVATLLTADDGLPLALDEEKWSQ